MSSIFRNMNKINILFLDIDGVLNNTDFENNVEINFYDNYKLNAFNKKLVENINLLIDRYDLKIVISSSWRKLFDIITLRDIFKHQFGIEAEILDYTTKEYLDFDYRDGKNENPRDRGLQITKWLNERKYNVNNYIVIDDDIDAEYGHENNFYKTNGERGFDYVAYLDCIAIFDKVFKKRG